MSASIVWDAGKQRVVDSEKHVFYGDDPVIKPHGEHHDGLIDKRHADG